MDVPRPDVARTKDEAPDHDHRGFGPRPHPGHVLLSRLKPAVPSVDRSTVWIERSSAGRWCARCAASGRSCRKTFAGLRRTPKAASKKSSFGPGAQVKPDTVILELTSPELEQAAHDAESKAKAAEAELTTLRATLQRELLDQESTTAQVHSEYRAGEDGARDERQVDRRTARSPSSLTRLRR